MLFRSPETLTCIETLCEHVRPEADNIIDAESLIASGLLALFIEEAIREPDRTAGFTASLVADPLNDVAGVFAGIAGVSAG